MFIFTYRKLLSIFLSKNISLKQESTLVWFYGISTIVGYLMPNPFIYNIYIYIYIYTVLFQTNQSSISTQFKCENCSISSN